MQLVQMGQTLKHEQTRRKLKNRATQHHWNTIDWQWYTP